MARKPEPEPEMLHGEEGELIRVTTGEHCMIEIIDDVLEASAFLDNPTRRRLAALLLEGIVD